jgi:hypothetical protein
MRHCHFASPNECRTSRNTSAFNLEADTCILQLLDVPTKSLPLLSMRALRWYASSIKTYCVTCLLVILKDCPILVATISITGNSRVFIDGVAEIAH